MKFALLITAAPFSKQGPATALRFAQAAVAAGHEIQRIFFFRDGVHVAGNHAVAPQDETHLPKAWQQFCRDKNIEAVVCVTAALKRGLVDERESQRHHLPSPTLAEGQQIGGLGLLTEMLVSADRVLTFG